MIGVNYLRKIKTIIITLLAVVLLFVSVFAVLHGVKMRKAEILTFDGDADAVFQNPMQGLYVQVDSKNKAALESVKASDIPLILLACNLNGYQDKELDENKLSELRDILNGAREYGLHIIFRSAYGFDEGFDTKEPNDFALVLRHIEQIAEILSSQSGQLVCVQAGMLGPWGEWHASRFIDRLSDDEQIKNRNAIAAAWISGLPDTVIVQLRRPLFVRQAEESGLPISRLGFHNDGLLASDSDLGTYAGGESAREEELDWVEKKLPHGLSGGEMPAINSYSSSENAIREFRKLHLTYLNSRYNKDVLDSWKNEEYEGENAFQYITRHLGIRLHISNATLPNGIFRLGKHSLDLNLTLKNTGFALPHPLLKVYIAVRQGKIVNYFPSDYTVSRENENVNISPKLSLSGILNDKDSFDTGIWIGYGHPEGGGIPVTLANKGLTAENGVMYFASYGAGMVFWELN